MSEIWISMREKKLTNTLALMTDTLTRVTAEKDALKKDLIFVERWVNHHARKPFYTPESVLSMIQHYPSIKAITKSYADGVLPTTPDPYVERDALATQLKTLRDSGVELPENKHPHIWVDCGGTWVQAGYTADQLRDYGDRRAMAERERCALLCEKIDEDSYPTTRKWPSDCAEAIRKGERHER